MRSLSTVRSIAANLKYLRGVKGLTQQALAERADVDLRHLQKIERARVPDVSVRLVEILAKALDVPVAELVWPRRLGPAKAGRPKAGKRT